MAHKDPSYLRKELDELLRELGTLVRTFTPRSSLWAGNVYVLRRRCGRPNCHCVEGELHEATVLSDRSGDSPRTIALKGNDIERFRRMTQKYGKVRKARARVTKINKRILLIVDELTDIRLKEGQKQKKRN